MPGPPRGPSYLMTTTSPATSWDSKTRAGPLKVNSSSGTPAVFTIAPSGARLPYRSEDPGRAAEGEQLLGNARGLHDRPVRRQVAVQHRAPAVGAVGVPHVADAPGLGVEVERRPPGRLRVRLRGAHPAWR